LRKEAHLVVDGGRGVQKWASAAEIAMAMAVDRV
jgi:hypothetical protein